MERIGVIASRLVAKLMAARERNSTGEAVETDARPTGTGRADDATQAGETQAQAKRFREERATKYTAAEVRTAGLREEKTGVVRAVRKIEPAGDVGSACGLGVEPFGCAKKLDARGLVW